MAHQTEESSYKQEVITRDRRLPSNAAVAELCKMQQPCSFQELSPLREWAAAWVTHAYKLPITQATRIPVNSLVHHARHEGHGFCRLSLVIGHVSSVPSLGK